MFTSIAERAAGGWARLFPNPRYYGWAVVGLSFLACALSSPGQSFAISLYIEEVIESLGASRLQVSSLYGAMTLLAAFFLPVVGNMADRYTGRQFLSWNIALLAVAIAFFASVQNLLMLAVAFFLLRLLGQGAIGLGTLTETVRWFRRYRGRALAVGGLGYAFGELVFPITIMTLVALVGWRNSLWVFAVIYLIVFVPVYIIFMRSRAPGELLDGDGLRLEHEEIEEPEEEISIDLKKALRTPVFWGLLGCVSVLPLVITAVIFHQVALFDAVGWGAERVPLSFMFFALASVAATYISGIILETVPCRYGISAGMGVAVLALAVAGWGGPPLWGSILYGVLFGLSAGILTAANSLVWPDYYGIEALGAIKGVVNGVRNGATAVGPPLVAWLIGVEEVFSSAFWVLGLMCLGAVIIAWWMKPPVAKRVSGGAE